MTLKIKIIRLPHTQDLPLPSRMTPGSSGMDLYAVSNGHEDLKDWTHTMQPSSIWMFGTGIKIQLPEGYEGQVRSRSGLAKHGIVVANSPGTIDSDYRLEVGVILINHGSYPFNISRGSRIAQLVVSPVVKVEWQEVDRLDTTQRNDGFGSTGF